MRDESVRAYCANPYCSRGKDGKPAIVAVRDMRQGPGYCSKPCESMKRYQKRYQGTMLGPVNPSFIKDKLTKL